MNPKSAVLLRSSQQKSG